jgi:hypothetical protein
MGHSLLIKENLLREILQKYDMFRSINSFNPIFKVDYQQVYLYFWGNFEAFLEILGILGFLTEYGLGIFIIKIWTF